MRQWMARAAVVIALGTVTIAAAPGVGPQRAKPTMVVYKSATCTCCKRWVEYMQSQGFDVKVNDLSDAELAEVKVTLGVRPALTSCHTAVIGNKVVIEGHVPADAIRRFLATSPNGVGLAVPGMPVGAKGMEQGERMDKYDVILFDRQGKTTVYASY